MTLWRSRAALGLILAAVLLTAVAAWPKSRTVVFVRCFQNLTVAGGHADLAPLEAGIRDDLASRLASDTNFVVVTADDDSTADRFDIVVSGAFAVVSERRVVAAARITDGVGRRLAGLSWTCNPLEPDLLRDQVSFDLSSVVHEAAVRGRYRRPDGDAQLTYADALRAIEDDSRDPTEIILLADVAAETKGDVTAAALIQAEAERRAGLPVPAAMRLAEAPAVPDDCLLGLLSWSVAYECSDPPTSDPAAARAAQRGVDSYPDLAVTWRTLALLSRDRAAARSATRNAVAAGLDEGSSLLAGENLRTLSYLTATRGENLRAAAAGMLAHYDTGTHGHARLRQLARGVRDGYAYGEHERMADDAHLWSLSAGATDWAVLAALGSFARERRSWAGEAFRPHDGDKVIAIAREAVRQARDAAPYARAAALTALGVPGAPAPSAALPDWRREDAVYHRAWRPVADAFVEADAARYPPKPDSEDPAAPPPAPNYEAAEAAYRHVLADLDPLSRHAVCAANAMYRSRGEPDRAISFWTDVCREQPDSPNGARGMSLARLARWQRTLSDAHREEARAAFGDFLNLARWHPSAIVEAAAELAGLGGAGRAVGRSEPAVVQPFYDDARAYLAKLDGRHAGRARGLLGWLEAQAGVQPAALGHLLEALDSSRWERRLQHTPGALDPICFQPSIHGIAGTPAKGLLLAHLSDACLRTGDLQESARWMLLAGLNRRQEALARLRADDADPVRVVAASRTVAAFGPATTGSREPLLWWFGCGGTISRFIVEDLDGDGCSEVIVGTRSDGSDRGTVYLLGCDGRMLARFEAASDLAGPTGMRFQVVAIAPADTDGDGKREIAVAANHDNDGIGRILLLDQRLRPLGEYWHAGHVQSLAPWPRAVGNRRCDDLAYIAINNHLGAPGQMVPVVGVLRPAGPAAQSWPCLVPGLPPIGRAEQPVYAKAAKLGFEMAPNALAVSPGGLLHVLQRLGESGRDARGVLADRLGQRVRRDDRDPGEGPSVSRPVVISGRQAALVIGVSRTSRPGTSAAGLERELEALRRGLERAGNAPVLGLLDEQVTASSVRAAIREKLGAYRNTRTAIWLHFSGHAFAEYSGGAADIRLRMFDYGATVSLRELWRLLGEAVPHCPVLITLDCCLTDQEGHDNGAAAATLANLNSWRSGAPAPLDGAIITACEPGRRATAGPFLRAATAVLADLKGALSASGFYNELCTRSSGNARPRIYVGGDMTVASATKPVSRFGSRETD